MIQVSAEQAIARLGELLEQAERGAQVVIVRADGAAFRLERVPQAPKPVFGSARGLIHMREDFEAPLEDFADYAP